MSNKINQRLDKKSVSIFWFIVLLIYYFCIHISQNKTQTTVLVGVIVLFNIIFYLFKVPRGYAEELIIMNYIGFFGVINAISLSVLLAVYFAETFFKFVLVLSVCLLVILVMVLIETIIFTEEFFQKSKDKKNAPNLTIVFIVILLGSFIRFENERISFVFITGLSIIGLSMLYILKLKAKHDN